VTDDLNRANFTPDGLLGLGFRKNSYYNAPNIVNTLLSQGKISRGVVAFKVAASGAELTIGGLNSDLYYESPYYTPITHPGVWQIDFMSLHFDNLAFSGGPALVRPVGLESTLLFSMLINPNRVPLSLLFLQR